MSGVGVGGTGTNSARELARYSSSTMIDQAHLSTFGVTPTEDYARYLALLAEQDNMPEDEFRRSGSLRQLHALQSAITKQGKRAIYPHGPIQRWDISSKLEPCRGQDWSDLQEAVSMPFEGIAAIRRIRNAGDEVDCQTEADRDSGRGEREACERQQAGVEENEATAEVEVQAGCANPDGNGATTSVEDETAAAATPVADDSPPEKLHGETPAQLVEAVDEAAAGRAGAAAVATLAPGAQMDAARSQSLDDGDPRHSASNPVTMERLKAQLDEDQSNRKASGALKDPASVKPDHLAASNGPNEDGEEAVVVYDKAPTAEDERRRRLLSRKHAKVKASSDAALLATDSRAAQNVSPSQLTVDSHCRAVFAVSPGASSKARHVSMMQVKATHQARAAQKELGEKLRQCRMCREQTNFCKDCKAELNKYLHTTKHPFPNLTGTSGPSAKLDSIVDRAMQFGGDTKKTAGDIYNTLGNAAVGSSQRQQMVETVEQVIVEHKRSMDRNNEWLYNFEERNESTRAKQTRDSQAIKRIEDNIDGNLVLSSFAYTEEEWESAMVKLDRRYGGRALDHRLNGMRAHRPFA